MFAEAYVEVNGDMQFHFHWDFFNQKEALWYYVLLIRSTLVAILWVPAKH